MKGYTAEKAFLAYMSLGQSSLPPAERLAEAWVYHLMHADMDSQSESSEIRETFGELRELFTRVKDDEIGSAMASAKMMNEDDVRRASELMASLIFRALDEGREQ